MRAVSTGPTPTPVSLLNDAPWRIVQGDCLAVLRELPDASVDAVVTDPPYGIRCHNKRLGGIANDERPFVWWLHDAFRVLRTGGPLLCFCRWDVEDAFRLAIEWAGFTVKSQAIWDRGTHGAGDTSCTFAPRHESIWFATKGRFRFPGKRPASVLSVLRVPYTRLLHPNEKPAKLMADLVEAVTRPGALVLDPFAGSGSTGFAAISRGRRFLGIELDEGYAQTARGRLEGAGEQLAAASCNIATVLE